jgi:hypothetical protein
MQDSPLTIRPILSSDRDRAIEISLAIWDDDYLPKVFDHWLEGGGFLGAELDGRLIAYSNRCFVAPGEAWLEGLRKDPSCERRGVGRALGIAHLSKLMGDGVAESIRFSTYFGNVESIALNKKLGFECVDALSIRTKDIPPDNSDACANVSGGSLRIAHLPSEAIEWAKGYADSSRFHGRWLCDGWRVASWDTLRFAEKYLNAERAAYATAAGEPIGLIAYDADPTYGYVKVAFVDAESDAAMDALLSFVEGRGRSLGMSHLEAMLRTGVGSIEAFERNGFSKWERDEDFMIFELPVTAWASYVG